MGIECVILAMIVSFTSIDSRFGIRIFVIPSSFDIRASSFAIIRANPWSPLLHGIFTGLRRVS